MPPAADLLFLPRTRMHQARKNIRKCTLLLAFVRLNCFPCFADTSTAPVEVLKDFAKSLTSTRDPILAVKQLGADERQVRKDAKKALLDMWPLPSLPSSTHLRMSKVRCFYS